MVHIELISTLFCRLNEILRLFIRLVLTLLFENGFV